MTATTQRTSNAAGPSTRDRQIVKPRRARAPMSDRVLKVWTILVFGFLFLPILVIVIYSFNTGRLLVAWDGFGFAGYTAIFDQPAIQSAVGVTLRTGIVASIVATLLGTLAGVAMARSTAKWVPLFAGLLVLVTVTPEIVDAVSLLPWFVFLGQDLRLSMFDDGFMRLVIGHSLFSIAVVSYIVRSRLVGLGAHLEEASADLYAPPLKTFMKVTLPLAMPAVLAGGLLSFTLSLDNTIISSFVSVAGNTPWPVYVLSAVRSGLRPEIASVSTLLLLLTVAALALVGLVLKRAGDSATQIARTMAGS